MKPTTGYEPSPTLSLGWGAVLAIAFGVPYLTLKYVGKNR